MAMDLIVSETGKVLIASDEAFAEEISRVEFFADARLLVLGFEDPESDNRLLGIEIDPKMMAPLAKAGRVTIIHFDKDAKPISGFDVPLVRIGV